MRTHYFDIKFKQFSVPRASINLWPPNWNPGYARGTGCTVSLAVKAYCLLHDARCNKCRHHNFGLPIFVVVQTDSHRNCPYSSQVTRSYTRLVLMSTATVGIHTNCAYYNFKSLQKYKATQWAQHASYSYSRLKTRTHIIVNAGTRAYTMTATNHDGHKVYLLPWWPQQWKREKLMAYFQQIAKFTTSLDKYHQVMSLVFIVCGRHALWPSLSNPECGPSPAP